MLYPDASSHGDDLLSVLHVYASHTKTNHATSPLSPPNGHPGAGNGTTDSCNMPHSYNADNNWYFHDADKASYEAQPDALLYLQFLYKNPASIHGEVNIAFSQLYGVDVESYFPLSIIGDGGFLKKPPSPTNN